MWRQMSLGGLALGGGGQLDGTNEGMKKMNHDVHRGSFVIRFELTNK